MEDNEKEFHRILKTLKHYVDDLAKRSKGRFNLTRNTCGYLVVPEGQQHLLNVRNKQGVSVREVCGVVWRSMSITTPHDIDVVWKDGKFVEGRLPEDTWAIIDRTGYGDNKCSDSFVYFKI